MSVITEFTKSTNVDTSEMPSLRVNTNKNKDNTLPKPTYCTHPTATKPVLDIAHTTHGQRYLARRVSVVIGSRIMLLGANSSSGNTYTGTYNGMPCRTSLMK